MTTFPRHIVMETLDWRGLLVQVSYEPHWMSGGDIAHLQVETLEPARAPLPITETGYRSHFIAQGSVEAQGGPSSYALAWLEHEALRNRWIMIEDTARQYSLF